ncbi:MAG: sensor histidine kinase [Promethearchaeota archaeon]
MIDESVLDFFINLLTWVAAFLYVIVSIKQKDLRKNVPSIFFFAFGALFMFLKVYSSNLRIVSNIIYAFGILSFFLATVYEEFKMIKQIKIKSKSKKSLIFILFQGLSAIFLLQLQALMVVLNFAIIIMLVHILYVKRTYYYVAYLFFASFAFLTLIFIILDNYDVAGAWELRYINNLISMTIVLVSPIIAYFEIKLRDSYSQILISERKYRRAYEHENFYKNLFTHDVNNIFGIIRGNACLGLIHLDSKEKPFELNLNGALSAIRNAVDRGVKLVTTVRYLSELVDNQNTESQKLELYSILKEALKYTENIFEEKQVSVKINPPDGNINIQASPLMLQVFENLLNNAIKYNTNPVVEITIIMSRVIRNGKRYVKLEFVDNGMGIPDDRKQKIFQKGHHDFKGGKGLGIGLSLILKVIQDSNGKIWVEDKVKGDHSKGSNFVVLLPETINQFKKD